jgi:hypothetical protein
MMREETSLETLWLRNIGTTDKNYSFVYVFLIFTFLDIRREEKKILNRMVVRIPQI